MWRKQICITDLDTALWQFSNTPEDKFQDQLMLIRNIWYTQVQNQQRKAWTKNLKDILYKSKQ